jgi:GxxExxY protein
MDKVVHKNLSYVITGLLFKTHRELGRFRSEKQYGDYFEKLLREEKINYIREHKFIDSKHGEEISRCICDFIIDNKIVLEFKAKSFITTEDYLQPRRYLTTLDFQLGIIVNFRQYRLSPKRVLNREFLLKNNSKYLN